MKTATFVAQRNGEGEGRIYECDPPHESHRFVWVSAVVVAFSGSETFIFGCNKKGDVQDWSELEGSFKGGLDIPKALSNAGYQIEEDE